MADLFFDRFAALVSAPAEAPIAPPAVGLLEMLPREPFGLPRIAWIGIVIYLAIMVLMFGSIL